MLLFYKRKEKAQANHQNGWNHWLKTTFPMDNRNWNVSQLLERVSTSLILSVAEFEADDKATDTETDVYICALTSVERARKAAVSNRGYRARRDSSPLNVLSSPISPTFSSKTIFMKPFTSALCTENSFKLLTCKTQEGGESFFTIYIVSEHMAVWSFFSECDGI